MADEPFICLSDADQAILFLIEAGFDIVPYQMDIIHRCFEVERD